MARAPIHPGDPALRLAHWFGTNPQVWMIRFWEWRREAFPRAIKSSSRGAILSAAPRPARCVATRSPLPSTSASSSATTRQSLDMLCREINGGRRKLLVEMATGTGKTRTATSSRTRLTRQEA